MKQSKTQKLLVDISIACALIVAVVIGYRLLVKPEKIGPKVGE